MLGTVFMRCLGHKLAASGINSESVRKEKQGSTAEDQRFSTFDIKSIEVDLEGISLSFSFLFFFLLKIEQKM